MKNITKKQSKEFNNKFTKGILEIGATIVPNSFLKDVVFFELETSVGKLEISLWEQSSLFGVFSRFEDVDKAKVKFDCNQNSGKYNFWDSTSLTVDKAVENALMHFECTLNKVENEFFLF